MPVRVCPFTAEGIAEAASALRAGMPVAVPTETVYGLAADASSDAAIAAVYAAKGRPSFNPLIVHVRDLATAERLGEFGDRALALAQAHWPGPLTLVVPQRANNGIARLATAGLPTIALRVPAHPAMQALLAAVDRPLAAPSANRSGAISPTTLAHALQSLEGRVTLALDGGPCAIGLESTIVALTGGPPRLLRPGVVQIEDAVAPSGGGVEAPGQLLSHYAPAKPLRVDATSAEDDEWLIGFGAVPGDSTLSAGGDLIEAAACLFERLHDADAGLAQRIAVAPVPEHGIGRAINDRLRRAAV